MIQFALQAPTARQVSVAGDFNNWDTKAGPMRKGPDGVWHLGVALKPGRYEYRFFADEVWCDDPAALAARPKRCARDRPCRNAHSAPQNY